MVGNEPGPELGTPIAQGRTVQELVEAVVDPLGPVPTEGGIETIGSVAGGGVNACSNITEC